MQAESLTRPRLLSPPRRLLAALSDERLATEIKRGNDTAFAVMYDRHHRGLLALCRHLLRSREDAEDALQQTLASALRALQSDRQPTQVKPWLYTIARNRCLTMLRARRETPVEDVARDPMAGLSEEVERRSELRELLADLDNLPERQKTALVLSEVGALDHAQVAEVLECETKQVKALVFQARSALIEDRRARETPCTEIREQLANASAGELRRSSLRRHVRICSGCAEFRDEIRCQRRMLAVALPVVPSFGLRESALAAVGMGGGGAAGGGGLIAALGAHGAAKVAAIAIATGGAVGGAAVTHPQLVTKAQAALERVANGVGDEASVSSRGGSPGARASRSLDRDTLQKGPRKKGRPELINAAADDPVADDRREPPRPRRPHGVDGPAKTKPSKDASHTRAGPGGSPKARGRGRRGGPTRSKPTGSSERGVGKGGGRRLLNLPDVGRRPLGGLLPRGGRNRSVPERRGLLRGAQGRARGRS